MGQYITRTREKSDLTNLANNIADYRKQRKENAQAQAMEIGRLALKKSRGQDISKMSFDIGANGERQGEGYGNSRTYQQNKQEHLGAGTDVRQEILKYKGLSNSEAARQAEEDARLHDISDPTRQLSRQSFENTVDRSGEGIQKGLDAQDAMSKAGGVAGLAGGMLKTMTDNAASQINQMRAQGTSDNEIANSQAAKYIDQMLTQKQNPADVAQFLDAWKPTTRQEVMQKAAIAQKYGYSFNTTTTGADASAKGKDATQTTTTTDPYMVDEIGINYGDLQDAALADQALGGTGGAYSTMAEARRQYMDMYNKAMSARGTSVEVTPGEYDAHYKGGTITNGESITQGNSINIGDKIIAGNSRTGTNSDDGANLVTQDPLGNTTSVPRKDYLKGDMFIAKPPGQGYKTSSRQEWGMQTKRGSFFENGQDNGTKFRSEILGSFNASHGMDGYKMDSSGNVTQNGKKIAKATVGSAIGDTKMGQKYILNYEFLEGSTTQNMRDLNGGPSSSGGGKTGNSV